MSFRKEKKYRLTFFEFDKFKNLMIEYGMKRLYKARLVNSLYYDTELLEMFYHSEEGVTPRKKIRIRWYDSEKHYNIENKVSSIEGRHKTSLNSKRNISESFPKTITDQLYGLLTPSLQVSYEREYYLINGARLTFDKSIKYKNLRHSSINEFKDPERVIEIKVGIDTSDDFIEKLIPYSTSRFSKYSRGLLISQGQNLSI